MAARRAIAFPILRAMTIPTGGLAAVLIVATFALTSCGGDDGAAPATTTPAPGAGTAEQAQTTQAATATTTTTQQAQTTTAPATTSTPPRRPRPRRPRPRRPPPRPLRRPRAPAAAVRGAEIGVREGEIEVVYARITKQRGVNCQTVTIVAQQWAGEQIGIAKALLPKDWSCRGNTCSGPKGSFSFELYKPQ